MINSVYLVPQRYQYDDKRVIPTENLVEMTGLTRYPIPT